MYVLANPLGMIDPSGHEDCATDACWQSEWAWKNRWYEAHGWFWENGGWGRQDIANFRDEQILRQTIGETGIGFADNLGAWTTPEMASIAQGGVALANKLGGIAGFGTLRDLLGVSGMLTWVNFFRIRSSSNLVAAHVGWGEVGEVDTRSVYFWNGTFSSAVWARGTAVHELGHVMDYHAKKSYKWFSENVPKGYEKELGEYSKNSPKDYFSEALASWVFDAPSGNPYNMARTAIAQAFPPELRCWLEVNVGATACTK